MHLPFLTHFPPLLPPLPDNFRSHATRFIATATIAITIGYANSAASAPLGTKIIIGTGIYISHEGHIITANHVISACKGDIGAYGRDTAVRLKLVASDEKHDLALLKVAKPLDVPNIAYFVALKEPIRVGDPVVVAGYPRSTLEQGDFPEFITNKGNIISTDSFLDKNNEKPLLFSNITEQGFSGGPVLDAAGNIIGITLAGTCIGEACRESFEAAMAGKPLSEPNTEGNDSQIMAHIDTNMAASLLMIREFLNKNHVPYIEADDENSPSADKIAAISQTIVNIRCPAGNEGHE